MEDAVLNSTLYSYFGNQSSVQNTYHPGNVTARTGFALFLNKFYLFAPPLIAVTAIIGNVLAFFVFVSKPLRRTSCSWYLAARSVSDGGFLVFYLLGWLSDVFRLGYFHVDGICQTIIFMSFFFAFISVWLTVVVTVENYIRICRPFSVQKFCNTIIAKRAIVGLFIISIAFNNFHIWITKVTYATRGNNTTTAVCLTKLEYAMLDKWVSLADNVVTMFVPSMAIIILMIAITFSLIKSLKRQSRLQGGASRNAGTNGQPTGSARSHRSNTSPQAKVTRMLFAVSFFFILLNGPSHIIRMQHIIITYSYPTTTELPTAASIEQQVQLIFNLIFYLSFAVNLGIYLTCGDSFRKQFKETYFPYCFRRSPPPGCSEMTAMSTVRLEELDNKNEDQTALIENSPTVAKENNNTCS
ncbi:sex peptide receptor-related protein 2-like [Physella acuta]|uniref:sex peptide receptor-related protein 2-like n=1 Tax=Physella acuta TaxID=109671 RepID=UPI0027DCD6EE|nr:sex peptide receptor-related protein 2-like [Physella acuta]